MTTIETLLDYLGTIRDAKNYISTNRGGKLSVDDIIALTDIARHLFKLEPDKADILAMTIELNCTSKENLINTKSAILSECQSFTKLYLEKRGCFDEQCSSDNIKKLINNYVENEFFLSKKTAEEEVSKWRNIYNKYNDITRLYNSMDCRPGQEKSDMRIINSYREELYDMVGHSINLKKVNKEHDTARATMHQKEKDMNEIRVKITERYQELLNKVDSDVLHTINSYIETIESAFSMDVNPMLTQGNIELPNSCPSISVPDLKPKRRRGRPSQEECYSKAGITDLKSCFTDEKYYDQLVNVIEKEPVNSIGGDVTYCIVTYLISSNCLKSEIHSTKVLANFLIKRFPKQFHITSGISSYAYDISPENEQTWKQKLSAINIQD